MSILTWKLVDSLTIVSETNTQESHQSFLCILLLLLPTNNQIKQYCYFFTPHSESQLNKCLTDIRTGKQELAGLYSNLTYRGKSGYFFPYLKRQSSQL